MARFLASTLLAVLATAVAVSLALAADLQGPALVGLKNGPAPFDPGSGEPCLAVSPSGAVWLSAFEPHGKEGAALMVARLDGERWSKPSVIAENLDFFVNWADFPRLLAPADGELIAHMPVRSGEEPYAYDVRLTRSRDGGATWGTPVTPHRDGTATEHGFVSLLPATGGVRVVWLDGRNAAGQKGHAEEGGVDMTVRTAVVEPAGAMREEAVLDGRVCDCCQTAAVAVPGGALVAYRDRSPDEVRDISLVRLENGSWSEPYALHRDGWKIAACPVNGPALASRGERVAAAWYTQAGDRAQVKVSFSEDGGKSFGTPIRADWGDPLGRVGIVLLEDGTALLAWMEQREKQAEFLVRRVRADGSTGLPMTIARTAATRGSGFPQLVVSGNRAILAWTESETGKPTRVRTAFATLPE
jgi:hypothetical protein